MRGDEQGVVQALQAQLQHQQLPRLLKLKAKVDAGQPLDDYDLRFLKDALAAGWQARSVMHQSRELQGLAGHIFRLYHQICDQALANERRLS
ncbi:hypothetical protein PVT67_16980 [Gallaecimonas kandeliae]|uniref:hypothetical protein n=1 Tax=Gallaecimonas kandeliae TaxID=3029055 RepID=UPI00264A43D4|nr:hypothetical protein [Gallaecimonas kandeliae]WKE65336.1 hypothetical protein PVT67_16980 [Gallaecimonas kandeliae]